MSITPVVRYRNFTLENLKLALEIYPDMSENMKWTDFEQDRIDIDGNDRYKRTAYQLACQLGVEDRSEENLKVQNYLYFLDDNGLKEYLKFWAKVYYAPNPYVNSDENSFMIYSEAGRMLLDNNNKIKFEDYLNKKNIDTGSPDILFNIFKNHLYPIETSKDNGTLILYINEDNKELLKNEINFIEKNFPIVNSKSKKDFFDRFSYQNFKMFFNNISYSKKNSSRINIDLSSEEVNRHKGGENRILYGVPGSGKSYRVKNYYTQDDRYTERIVFYPEYSSFDFIGQILPKISSSTDKLEYSFIPGPFTKILKKSILDPENMYYLVIEEINRGNAASIFGDVFVLLDRESDGTSSYFINNRYISNYIYGIEDVRIYIPSNLTLLATMNTSDQNVFTLDSAFQRRWNMELIFNDIEKCSYKNKEILNTGITWKQFITKINEKILSENINYTNMEDKRLGSYFIEEEYLEYKVGIKTDDEVALNADKHNNIFADKIIKYLWTDVFKYNRHVIFKEKYNSLEDVIKDFQNQDIGMDIFNIDF